MNYDKILKFAHESVGRADDAGRFAIALVEQQATLERYKAALEWYADTSNHGCIQHQEGDCHFMRWPMVIDCGETARKALAGGK